MGSSISVLPPGSLISLVAPVWQQTDAGTYEFTGLSPVQDFRLECNLVLQPDRIYTFYELVKVNHGEQSQCFPKSSLDHFGGLKGFVVCSGMGVFALGLHPLDIETSVFLDSNALACDQLRVGVAGS